MLQARTRFVKSVPGVARVRVPLLFFFSSFIGIINIDKSRQIIGQDLQGIRLEKVTVLNDT